MGTDQNPESASQELYELRCLHELARQLLPLSTARDAARDGLLCIAGITGIGAGAVLWQRDEPDGFHLLSHFGLAQAPGATTSHLDEDSLEFLRRSGPVTLAATRRSASGTLLFAALEPFVRQLGDAWVLPLIGEKRIRGLLLLGPSLVTDELLHELDWLQDLAETLRLALLGCIQDAHSAATGAAESGASASALESATPRSSAVSERLLSLRHAYPVTRDLVGESPAVLAMLEEIVSLAETDYTVMIQGGTGTGKELAASLLHRLSRRAKGPFEAVDCSSIPRELIESELFGHVKGAFTGASRDYKGAFDRADGGSLLLDEIGDMDLRSQTRLLRVLQEGKVRPLGGDRPVSVDVRVIAATNRDLAAMVRAGTFREDLYYRIHVCPLPIPALRERGDDSVVLFEHFMRQHAAELGRMPRALTAEGRRLLGKEPFPGNVRQLQNVVRQLLVQRLTEGSVSAEELGRVLATAARAPIRGEFPQTSEQVGGESSSAEKRALHEAEATNSGAQVQPAAAGASGRIAETVVDDIGQWVLEQLRVHHFNLVAAARHLQALRRSGVSRSAVPVFDRGALDYYLCGELFKKLAERGYDLEQVVYEIAADSTMVPRVRRKVRAFLRPLAQATEPGSVEFETLLRENYRRLPERYHVALGEAIEAVREGRWSPGEA